jgi:hypothetical protein
MLIPEYILKDLSVGSGSIIGKNDIEEFFNHVSKHKDIENRSLAEFAPNYETAAAHLVHMLEARFVNLNPTIQQIFLKLHDVEDAQKRDFILETLHKEFRDVVIEARNVFDHFNMLGSCVDVIGTLEKTGEIDSLTVSWGKVVWLCYVQVPRCCWRRHHAQDFLWRRCQSQLATTFGSGFFLLLVD